MCQVSTFGQLTKWSFVAFAFPAGEWKSQLAYVVCFHWEQRSYYWGEFKISSIVITWKTLGFFYYFYQVTCLCRKIYSYVWEACAAHHSFEGGNRVVWSSALLLYVHYLKLVWESLSCNRGMTGTVQTGMLCDGGNCYRMQPVCS